jgi:hypothetical protein
MAKRKLRLPMNSIRAAIQPDSFNEEKRTVDVTWTTGARVKRWSWEIGEYYEELDVSKKAVRMERLENGAPVLKDHVANLENMIGVVENAKVRKGEGTATLRFSEREDAQAVFRDIGSGIVQKLSFGYIRHKVERINDPNGDTDEIPVYRVIDWEPYELTFLPVPADNGAQVRSQENSVYECEIINEGGDMCPKENETREQPDNTSGSPATEPGKDTQTRSEPTVDEKKVREQATTDERNRQDEIRSAVKLAKLENEVADDMVKRGLTIDESRKEILEKLAENDQKQQTRSSNASVGEDNTLVGMKRGIENAILVRMGREELKDEGKSFRFLRLIDMAKELLEYRGISVKGYAPMELAARGLHSTSDFPELLANVAGKTLRMAFEESPQSFLPFTRKVENPDFKEVSRIALGDAPALREKKESGEYEYGTFSEAAEKYSVKTYGRIILFSREMLVNDDLNGFARMPEMFGRAAANLESDLVWGVITANRNMADGNALFSAAHGNLAAGGDIGAPSVTTLGTARESMRLQTGLDGNKLNIIPKNVGVPANHETVLDQLLATITPSTVGEVNPFGPQGRTPMGGLVEPRLDDDSVSAWYVFADTAQIDMMELAYLVGERAPVIDSMIDFNSDGLKMKVRHTCGSKAIDWRGMYLNPGV